MKALFKFFKNAGSAVASSIKSLRSRLGGGNSAFGHRVRVTASKVLKNPYFEKSAIAATATVVGVMANRVFSSPPGGSVPIIMIPPDSDESEGSFRLLEERMRARATDLNMRLDKIIQACMSLKSQIGEDPALRESPTLTRDLLVLAVEPVYVSASVDSFSGTLGMTLLDNVVDMIRVGVVYQEDYLSPSIYRDLINQAEAGASIEEIEESLKQVVIVSSSGTPLSNL